VSDEPIMQPAEEGLLSSFKVAVAEQAEQERGQDELRRRLVAAVGEETAAASVAAARTAAEEQASPAPAAPGL
jgi:hypothetical protein